jgi:hypothetical protein
MRLSVAQHLIVRDGLLGGLKRLDNVALRRVQICQDRPIDEADNFAYGQGLSKRAPEALASGAATVSALVGGAMLKRRTAGWWLFLLCGSTKSRHTSAVCMT